MIRKRRPLATHSNKVPRARQDRAPLKRRTKTPSLIETETSLQAPTTSRAKQELILTHAEAWKHVSAVNSKGRAWLMSGVIVSFFMILLGWWFTFGRSLADYSNSGPDALLQVVRGESKQLREQVGESAQLTLEQVKLIQAQRTQEEVLRRMAAALPEAEKPTSTSLELP